MCVLVYQRYIKYKVTAILYSGKLFALMMCLPLPDSTCSLPGLHEWSDYINSCFVVTKKTSWFLNYWIFFSKTTFTVNVLLMLASIIFWQHRMKPWRRIPILLLLSYMSTWKSCNNLKWEQYKEARSVQLNTNLLSLSLTCATPWRNW